ncbi:MAG: hypothetical protein U0528_05560 [Anaerolineae bacterium]|nr:hypothetical protein [Anaerolineae bacterium]
MEARLLGHPTLFHSGQTIPFTAVYEIVGSTGYLNRTKVHAFLIAGDNFPYYEGRGVSWCVSATEVEKPSYVDNQQPQFILTQEADEAYRAFTYVG